MAKKSAWEENTGAVREHMRTLAGAAQSAIKVYITPSLDEAPYGILRVIEAMHKELPKMGIQIVHSEKDADVVNCHAMSFVDTDKPVVYTSHGLYWGELYWPVEYGQANQKMIDFMSRSQFIVAVSDWVAQSIRRGINRHVEVISHGIDTADWQPIEPNERKPYVLWNKARADVVSNPADMQQLAERMPDTLFVTTIGEKRPNVQVLGVLPHDEMRQVIQQAGVYLCTARETYGIGTLEALACGVPVVGWDHGGQREIFEDHSGGILVPYGRYDLLEAAIRKVTKNPDHKEAYDQSARETAVAFSWHGPMRQYAQLFKSVAIHSAMRLERPAVSIIITAHNLGKYLPDCLESVAAQPGEWECLIIDDCSTDDTAEIAKEMARKNGRFSYFKTPSNLKLSGARNFGFELAMGRHIMYLDADDMLAEGAVDLLSSALEADPAVHIVYGHLNIMNEDGSEIRRNDWPFDQFNWFGQMAHLNQLPYCAMMRREVIENIGGYRQREWRAEDASFWCRATSFGYRASKVSQDAILHYRLRPDSKGATERREKDGDGDWTSWYPWRIAGNSSEGFEALKKKKLPTAGLVPFGAQGRLNNVSWPVWSHHDPVISVIIPVGPGHRHLLIDALDSLIAQDFPFWEAVVINDTGKPLELPYAPWARVVDCGKHNIAVARNAGIHEARGDLLLFLDADDILVPSAMREMLTAYVENDGSRYIYTDWFAADGGTGKITKKQSREYDRKRSNGSSHAVTALFPREWVDDMGGGFDPDCPGWEDWEFFVRAAVRGMCGKRLASHLFVYRMHTGERREESLEIAGATLPFLRERYAPYFEGKVPMGSCCGGNGDSVLKAKQALGLIEPSVRSISIGSDNMTVRIEYLGKNVGPITLTRAQGSILTRAYRAGDNPVNKFHDADPHDAELLVSTGRWRLVDRSGGGLDLSQMTTPQTAVTGLSGEELSLDAIATIDPSSKTVSEVKTAVTAYSAAQLRVVLDAEETNKNRPSLVSYLETLIKDAERVSA